MPELNSKLEQARMISWQKFGRCITFYLPGMFIYNNESGKYPAVSITAAHCALNCEHCQAKILEPMIPATTPVMLFETCLKLAAQGNIGVLISGGCDENGRLPWDDFIPVIADIKSQTDLYISIHSGLVDENTAGKLKAVGIDQALIDVIGDDETYHDIYHVNFGVSRILDSMRALQAAGLPIIPHVVCGLYYGNIKGEQKAIEMISQFNNVEQVVIVSLMRLRGTPLWHVKTTPSAEAVAGIIAETRFAMPDIPISLGCARQRGNSWLDVLAVDAGVNYMALPSEEAIHRAKEYGLKISYQRTCCSVKREHAADHDAAFI
jgi:uncharacterized radical SAM superfamily protein